MFYFGKFHNAPVYFEDDRVSTPVGKRCARCDEPIIEGDDGFVMPALLDAPPPGMAYYHRACLLRTVLGSLAHLKRQCSCYVPGATCTDPPSMTLRQAAEAVVEYMERA